MMPRHPSEPNARVRTSMPSECLPPETTCIVLVGSLSSSLLLLPFHRTPPFGPTILADTTMSSMFPYLLLFIPLAFVAIQPPKVLNSMLSGSWPMVYPLLSKNSTKSRPVIPASTCARPSSSFSFTTRSMRFVLTVIIGRGSICVDGHRVASITLVPPPYGIKHHPFSLAALTTAITCSSDDGQRTPSGIRILSPFRRPKTSS
mmetsp:Transcript_26147/g.56035  ORF Transcript_26147/g.56035 Transcript_26147/m.56035 type:complete len:203 (+) Transcript_26147:1521-2129(+)